MVYRQGHLARDVQELAGTSARFSRNLVGAVLEALRRAIRRGDRVALPRLGTFRTVRVERHRTHLPDGRIVEVPTYYRVVFEPSEVLKRELRCEDE